MSFKDVNRQFYGRKLRFTAPLARRRNTKFPIIKPTTITSKNDSSEYIYPLIPRCHNYKTRVEVLNRSEKKTDVVRQILWVSNDNLRRHTMCTVHRQHKRIYDVTQCVRFIGNTNDFQRNCQPNLITKKSKISLT